MANPVKGAISQLGERVIGSLKNIFNEPTYYHGTFSDIEEFDPNMVDIGIHVGTQEQANGFSKRFVMPLATKRQIELRP